MTKKILIVDDEQKGCDIMKDFFSFGGYDVLTAQDGLKAIQMVKEQQPFVVLLDIVMPGMSGIDVLKEIKAIDSSIHVIMLTGLQDQKFVRQAMQLGAYEFLTKPVDIGYVDKIVESLFASSIK